MGNKPSVGFRITILADRAHKSSLRVPTSFQELLLELGVQPEVDDWVDAHGGLGEHGGDPQQEVGGVGVWSVSSCFCY